MMLELQRLARQAYLNGVGGHRNLQTLCCGSTTRSDGDPEAEQHGNNSSANPMKQGACGGPRHWSRPVRKRLPIVWRGCAESRFADAHPPTSIRRRDFSVVTRDRLW